MEQDRIGWEEFLRAFRDATSDMSSADYGSATLWTHAMLNTDTGIIRDICRRLAKRHHGLRCVEQWYTVDAMFVSGKTPGDSFPERVHCVIEHENGSNWHEELWKLAHWRCPLKVLIAYDFNEDLKRTDCQKDWLEERIGRERARLAEIASFQGTKVNTHYLLIVGQKKSEVSASVDWRACLLTPDGGPPRPIEGLVA